MLLFLFSGKFWETFDKTLTSIYRSASLKVMLSKIIRRGAFR